jgi:hypothetical protein
VEECTFFWGVKTSWGINTTENKRPLNQEDNQAPQPTIASHAIKEGYDYIRLCLDVGFLQRVVMIDCDSQSAISLAKNIVCHSKTKHIRV